MNSNVMYVSIFIGSMQELCPQINEEGKKNGKQLGKRVQTVIPNPFHSPIALTLYIQTENTDLRRILFEIERIRIGKYVVNTYWNSLESKKLKTRAIAFIYEHWESGAIAKSEN